MQPPQSLKQGYRNKSQKLLLQGGRVVISMEVDHLKIEARVDKMQETTEGIKIMAHSDLGVRILIIGVIRDMGQTQTKTLNQMEDLGAGADLITAQMYSILELLVKL